MLVDGVGGLSGCGIVEDDLEDDVDPGVVFRADDEGWIVGIGVGCGVGVKEEGCFVI